MTGVPAFSVTGPLPAGTTLLEASAGTGKTYTIAALATRYVAEGVVTVDQLLIVTFGRAATRELRERVRGALTRARDALGGGASTADDPVLSLLSALPPAQRALARARLATAVADFDAATIATTHQFCRRTLAGLGIAADVDPGETFTEDVVVLVEEVVADLYLRRYGRATTDSTLPAADPELSLADARRIARAVVADPQSALVEAVGDPDSADALRVRFAGAVAAEVARRRRAQRLVGYDDLVLRLAAALTDPVTGAVARDRLRDAYQVVLVDEFQDTDPAQWRILHDAFHGHRTLVLIGDPKQAIYAFRGADVFSYLAASAVADHRATLPTNHRSDGPVVEALDLLLGGLELGDPRIVVHPVTAARPSSRITGGPGGAAGLRLRVVGAEPGVLPKADEARELVAADVAADVVALLSGTARLRPGHGPDRAVRPGDVAVLVTRNAQGELVRRALARCGVPAVVSAPVSVFGTPAAGQWRTLLRALETPRRGEVRAAALTDFLGRSGTELAAGGDALDDELGALLRDWGRVLEADGVAALLATVTARTDLMRRVLAGPDGERRLTDLRHVAAQLHAEQRRSRFGVTGLLDWLTERIVEAATDPVEQTATRTRRLETDAAAVQILTVHRSKGLEFPIVYVPFGWDRYVPDPVLVRCHQGGRRVLDVRTRTAPGRRDLVAAHRAEDDGESLRLLYVALTRASSAVVAHWAPGRNAESAPLTRVLAARGAGVSTPAASHRGSAAGVGWLAGASSVTVETVPERPAADRWRPPAAASPTLAAAPWARRLDATWRRTSYTGLTAGLHASGSTGGSSAGAWLTHDAPESAPPGFREDEPEPLGAPSREALASPGIVGSGAVVTGRPLPPGAAGNPAPTGAVSPFADLPGGPAFGTLVHAALETIDPHAGGALALAAGCRAALAAHPVPGVGAEPLAVALAAAFATPLGPLADGRPLAGFPAADRLAELEFELPLGAAAPADDPATLGRLADLIARHLPDDDPLASYPDRLRAAGLGDVPLRGYLTGSIDAVLRLPGSRHLVVDYKTNRVGIPGTRDDPGLVSSYRPSALPDVMMAAHYPLQALLYSAALHRFLRWRLAGYEPTRHLGGVLYLFLRGMAGPDTPVEHGQACGVFAWAPPAALVVELSDLLDGRA